MPEHASGPSSRFASLADCLDTAFEGADSVSAAVAFLSQAGASILLDLIGAHGLEDVDLVVRGAPITEPEAVLQLDSDPRITVSLIVGEHAPRYHPKLWLVRSETRLTVVSGSGNLTTGGMRSNREQFELLRHEDPGAIEHEELRFGDLTAGAVPAARMQGSIAWREWVDQAKERDRLAKQLRRLDEKLARSPAVERAADQRALLEDLYRIHDEIVRADIPRKDGQVYRPTRFKQGLDRARENGDAVRFASNICRRQTEGFDVIFEANLPEMTVEFLVVDQSQDYHDLFDAETVKRARQRLEHFPAWRG